MLEAQAGDNTAALANLGSAIDMNSDAIGMNSSDIAGLNTDITKLESDIEALDVDAIGAGAAGGASGSSVSSGAKSRDIAGSNPGIEHYADAASIIYGAGAGNLP